FFRRYRISAPRRRARNKRHARNSRAPFGRQDNFRRTRRKGGGARKELRSPAFETPFPHRLGMYRPSGQKTAYRRENLLFAPPFSHGYGHKGRRGARAYL